MKKILSIIMVIAMMLSMSAVSFAATWQEAGVTGVKSVNPGEYGFVHYPLGAFTEVDGFYEASVLMQKVTAIDDDNNTVVYEKDTNIVFNYRLSETKVAASAYLFGGTKNASSANMKMLYRWDAVGSITGKITVPENDFIFMLVFVVEDVSLTDLTASISLANTNVGYMDYKLSSEALKLGEYTVELDKDEFALMPAYDDYAIVRNIAFAGELEPAYYGVSLTSEDLMGCRAYLVNNYGDVVAQVAANNIAEDNPVLNFRIMEKAKYKLVVTGYNADTMGTLTVKVDTYETTFTNTDIDVSNQNNIILDKMGDYTIKGENNDAIITIGNGVHVTLDSAKIGGVVLNNDTATVQLTAKGRNVINATQSGYAVSNVKGAIGGVKIDGDVLLVEASENAVGGILLNDAPLFLGASYIGVKTIETDGYYPVAIWTVGKNTPTLTPVNGVTSWGRTILLEYSKGFIYGYAIGTFDLVEIGDSQFKFQDAPTDAVVSKYLCGDANLDGEINTADAVTILRGCAGLSELDIVQNLVGDTTKDDIINTGDATLILKYAAGLVEQL